MPEYEPDLGEFDDSLGYEIEDDGLPELPADPPPQPSRRDKSPHFYLFLGGFSVFLLAIAAHNYLSIESTSEYDVMLAECRAQAQAAQASQQICEQSRLILDQARREEVNITAQCWEKLDVCNDNVFELAGINLTQSELRKDRQVLLKELEDTRQRLEKLQEALG